MPKIRLLRMTGGRLFGDPQPPRQPGTDGASARRPFDALIVDFAGVMTTPLQDAMVRFAASTGIELQDLARVALAVYAGGEDDLVVGFETGRISEADFSIEFARRLESVANRSIDPQGLVGRVFDVELEEEMFDGVTAARAAGLETALLSNSWGGDLYPRDRLDEMFDVVIISGEVGLRKPDPQIFRLVLERLGRPADRCVFVDDNPGHLDVAESEGMTTLLHTSPAGTLARLEDLLGAPLRSQR